MAENNSSGALLVLQRAAAALLAVLLAGYVIFNKPFATLGWPPIYIGEIAIALALLAVLPSFKVTFVEPVKRSWTFRLMAAFIVYGALRAFVDYFTHGQWAARDSVIA